MSTPGTLIGAAMRPTALLSAGAHATVTRALRLVGVSEWKRRQVPFRIKLTRLACGRDRRMPIANTRRYTPTPLTDFDAATTTSSDTTTKERP